MIVPKKNITAVIVEDELMPRLSLIQKIETYHPDITILEAFDTYGTALPGIIKHQPALLFLDIQLGGKTSLDMIDELQRISSLSIPYIIFTTAYTDPEYLLKAIKLEAVDYLTKPVTIEDLAKAIKKVKQKLQPAELINNTADREVKLKTGNSFLIIKEKDILFFTANRTFCTLKLADHSECTILESISELETKFGCSSIIIRAGRSHIINKSYVYRIDVRKKICEFQTPDHKKYYMPLSENAISEVAANFE